MNPDAPRLAMTGLLNASSIVHDGREYRSIIDVRTKRNMVVG
jgi:hypothetical protein